MIIECFNLFTLQELNNQIELEKTIEVIFSNNDLQTLLVRKQPIDILNININNHWYSFDIKKESFNKKITIKKEDGTENIYVLGFEINNEQFYFGKKI